jgi:hypothetical protein
MQSLDKLWSLLTMDPEFDNVTIVFTGNYLSGSHARQMLSFLCTLRLAHPSPIFLSGPADLAAAAYLGLLKNLELSVALNAVGTTWAEENRQVFASYGVSTFTATDLLHAMPPEHREFLTELAVSVKHPNLVLTAMPATTLAASSLTSEFASDFFSLPHPIHDASALATVHSDSLQAPSAALGSAAATAADNRDEASREYTTRTHTGQRAQVEEENATKTMYVDSLAQFPCINADGIAMNGVGCLAGLFFPSGRVVVASSEFGEK